MQVICLVASCVQAGPRSSCWFMRVEVAMSIDVWAPATSCNSTPISRSSDKQTVARRTQKRMKPI